MMRRAYLAGPDVFLADAAAHAARKRAICAAHGLEGLTPLAEDASAWRAIFAQCVAMMERCDLVIANLTPFRGASADAGTLVELGWFLGRGLPVFAYSNTAVPFTERSRAQVAVVADPLPGLALEGFGLVDNLMVPGAVETGGAPVFVPPDGVTLAFDDLEVFERCVARIGSEAGVSSPARTGPQLLEPIAS